MSRESIRRSLRPARRVVPIVCLALLLSGFVWPWDRDGPWPPGTDTPVMPIGFPTLESRIQALPDGGASGFRFVAFGDQRALADGEWQSMLGHIAALGERDPGLLFLLDTGDIVNNGRHGNQFSFLRELLDPVKRFPYLVGVGNHEVHNNDSPAARDHLATFLSGVDPALSSERLYYRKDVGPLRLLFLDTNDLVYGDDGAEFPRRGPAAGSRAETQLRWLERQLADDDRGPNALTVAVLHHPFVQSSSKHRDQAAALWSYRWSGRTLPDLLLDGGVDVVLAGHTHTTERFRLRRADGEELQLLNLSGRPRDGYLWYGSGTRRARDIAGRESKSLAAAGWDGLDGWTITQEHAMMDDAADQFGIFRVDANGGLDVEIVYLDPDAADGVRRDPPATLH